MTIQELARKLGLMVLNSDGFSYVFFCFTDLNQRGQEALLNVAYDLAKDAYRKEKSRDQLKRLLTKGNAGKSLVTGDSEILGMVNTRQEMAYSWHLLFSVNMMVAARTQGRGLGTFMHRQIVKLATPHIYGRYTQNPAVYLSLKKAFPNHKTYPQLGHPAPPDIQILAQRIFETLGSSGTFDAATMIRNGGRSYQEGVTKGPIHCGKPEIDEYFASLWPDKNYMVLTLFV